MPSPTLVFWVIAAFAFVVVLLLAILAAGVLRVVEGGAGMIWFGSYGQAKGARRGGLEAELDHIESRIDEVLEELDEDDTDPGNLHELKPPGER